MKAAHVQPTRNYQRVVGLKHTPYLSPAVLQLDFGDHSCNLIHCNGTNSEAKMASSQIDILVSNSVSSRNLSFVPFCE